MVLMQLDLTRFIQVYIVQGIVGIIYLIIAYKILKRDTKRLNVILSLFYILGATGVFLNWIYAPLTDEPTVFILNFLTNYCFFLAPIFLVVFELILLKSEKMFTRQKQLLVIIIYGVIMFCSIFIPNGVTINASTDWKPVWSLPFFIYVIIFFSLLGLLPTFHYGFAVYKKFENEELKKKWKYYLIGIIGLAAFTIGTFFSNTLNDPTFRVMWAFVALPLIIISPILIYLGVGKQLKKEEIE